MEQQAIVAWHSAGFTIVPARRHLLHGSQVLDIEAKVFDLIVLLIGAHERALDKRELTTALWGRRPVTDAALSQLVHKARRALDDDGERQVMIRTVYGRGLQWAAPVEAVLAQPPAQAAEPSPVLQVATTTSARRPWWLAAVAVLLIGLLGLWWQVREVGTGSALPRLALLPIENATGDTALDWVQNGLPGLIGSLLGESGQVDVGDALQVAAAAGYTPAAGRSPRERLRYATGATIVVGGRLRRLGAALYELQLQVDDRAPGPARELVVTGKEPALLGVDAAARILRLVQPAVVVDADTRHAFAGDAYLAQTFARGVNLALHGDWENAKAYFALCVQNQPDFLPARLRLGEAQANTHELAASETTLQALVEQARQQHQDVLEGAALMALAENQFRRGDRHAALALLEQAREPIERGGDADARVRRLLLVARAQAILQQGEAAAASLQQARGLIAREGLHQRLPLLHNVEEQAAAERRDYAAQGAAALAALAAAEQVGDERMVIAQTYRLGRLRGWQERPFDALPLLARAWQRAQANKLLDIELPAGVELGWVLSETGHYEALCAVADRLVAQAQTQPNAWWKAIALATRGRCERGRGDAAAALATYRQAQPLIDRQQDPQLDALVFQYSALAAFAAERSALSTIAQALADAGPDRAYLHVRRLVAGLVAAARGEADAAVASLAAEAADPDPDDGQGNELRRVALHVALALDSPAAAQLASHNADVLTSNDVEVLRLYAQWCARHGEPGMQQRVQARIDEVRQRATDALSDSGLALPTPD